MVHLAAAGFFGPPFSYCGLYMRRTIVASFLMFFAASIQAQTPGTRLSVDVALNSIVLRGDTVGITYVLFNKAVSQDSLWTFTVDAPAGVTSIPEPQPAADWSVDVAYGGRSVADWANHRLISPGTSSGELYFESVGLPGVVTDWVGGNFPVPDNDTSPQNPLLSNSVSGKTVGVEVFPTDRSTQALLSRIRSLTQATCASPLLWITNSSLCSDLLTDIDQAEAYRSSGQFAQARSTVDHFMTLLAGPSPGTVASGVTSSGYWLLRSNAEIVKNLL